MLYRIVLHRNRESSFRIETKFRTPISRSRYNSKESRETRGEEPCSKWKIRKQSNQQIENRAWSITFVARPIGSGIEFEARYAKSTGKRWNTSAPFRWQVFTISLVIYEFPGHFFPAVFPPVQPVPHNSPNRSIIRASPCTRDKFSLSELSSILTE